CMRSRKRVRAPTVICRLAFRAAKRQGVAPPRPEIGTSLADAIHTLPFARSPCRTTFSIFLAGRVASAPSRVKAHSGQEMDRDRESRRVRARRAHRSTDWLDNGLSPTWSICLRLYLHAEPRPSLIRLHEARLGLSYLGPWQVATQASSPIAGFVS